MIWLRASDGVLFGVCKGLSKIFQIPVGVLRAIWIFAFLFGGFGFVLYILFALSLPREDEYWRAYDRRVLGVCSRLARKTEVDVGLVRFLVLCSALMSFGLTVVVYFVLNFILDNESNRSDA